MIGLRMTLTMPTQSVGHGTRPVNPGASETLAFRRRESIRDMPTVYVNDKPVEIGTQKLNCIQAAELAGVFIPSYCWHEALTVVASCRMCLVEVGDLKDGKPLMQPKVVPGCQTPVKDGTVIVTGEYDKRDPALALLAYD